MRGISVLVVLVVMYMIALVGSDRAIATETMKVVTPIVLLGGVVFYML